jgi:hypothetical protein
VIKELSEEDPPGAVHEMKDRLLRYLDFMDSELNDFSKFSRIDWKTYNAGLSCITG